MGGGIVKLVGKAALKYADDIIRLTFKNPAMRKALISSADDIGKALKAGFKLYGDDAGRIVLRNPTTGVAQVLTKNGLQTIRLVGQKGLKLNLKLLGQHLVKGLADKMKRFGYTKAAGAFLTIMVVMASASMKEQLGVTKPHEKDLKMLR